MHTLSVKSQSEWAMLYAKAQSQGYGYKCKHKIVNNDISY